MQSASSDPEYVNANLRFRRRATTLLIAVLCMHSLHILVGVIFADADRFTTDFIVPTAILTAAFYTVGFFAVLRLRTRGATGLAVGMCALCVIGTIISIPFCVLVIAELGGLMMLLVDIVYLVCAVACLYRLLDRKS